jgi:hypothetical protein
MIIVDLIATDFTMTLTLGDEDTSSPPPLLLAFDRPGTNFSGTYDLTLATVIPGDRFLTIEDIPTSIFLSVGVKQSGQYNFRIYDNTVPATPIEIENGLLQALTTPITKDTYGTDKERGEYKGHN